MIETTQKTEKIHSLVKNLIGLTFVLTLFTFSGYGTENAYHSDRIHPTELLVSLESVKKSTISLKSIVQKLHTTQFISNNESIFSLLRFEQAIKTKVVTISKRVNTFKQTENTLQVPYTPRQTDVI